eukprot:TRINITY_DN212_c0_g1_i1.p1 TRINITY_DN212_c0_g1~~TRINITY_DN212_c0_g1_i1.p1  ORF type:complete len:297 (-),score=64.05 TRINITY_DN212_c0_g1_i1:115-1005(-)
MKIRGLVLWVLALLLLGACSGEHMTKVNPSSDRLLCWVLTTGVQAARCRTIEATWGKHCDVLIFVTSDSLEGVGLNNRSIVEVVPVVPDEGRFNLYPKTFSAWKVVYEKYRDAADYFLKADDDTFVIVPNMKAYLRDLTGKTSPLAPAWYTGAVLQHEPDQPRFGIGGAGYAVNHAGLMKLGKGIEEGVCVSKEGPEDRLFGRCMNKIGLYVISTTDEESRERQLQLPLEKRFDKAAMYQRYSKWWFKKTENQGMGENCCSRKLGTVHKIPEHLMRMYYFMFYKAERFVNKDKKQP